MKIFWFALIFSIIYHLLQFFGVYWIGGNFLKMRQPPEVVEIELSSPDPAESIDKPIIKAPDLQKKPPEIITKPAELFSDSTQRFEKQMQAKKKGAFQQKMPAPSPRPQQQPPQVQVQKKFEFEGAVGSQRLNSSAANQWTFKTGESQLEYNLPKEIPYGEITVLDTDTHIYASFYNRVVDLFYIRWVQRLDSVWDRLSYDAKRQLSGRTWLTEVEIVLNSDGVYQNGRLRSPSGFPPFDQAVLYAFQSAQVFPNPPRGKIDPDGRVRLKYRVAVQVY